MRKGDYIMNTPPTYYISDNDWIIVKNSPYKNNPLIADVLCIVSVPKSKERQFNKFVAEISLYGYRRVIYGGFFKKRKIDLSTYPRMTLKSFMNEYKK